MIVIDASGDLIVKVVEYDGFKLIDDGTKLFR